MVLAANFLGEKLTPLVIGKAAKPRCFKNIKKENLPVIWRNNKKAWMKKNLFKEWLEDLNKMFAQQGRKIFLFLANSSSHCEMALSNIKIHFLPANTTSICQPLDQGIIKCFKGYYRKKLLLNMISKVDDNSQSSQINLPEANVLDAVY